MVALQWESMLSIDKETRSLTYCSLQREEVAAMWGRGRVSSKPNWFLETTYHLQSRGYNERVERTSGHRSVPGSHGLSSPTFVLTSFLFLSSCSLFLFLLLLKSYLLLCYYVALSFSGIAAE